MNNPSYVSAYDYHNTHPFRSTRIYRNSHIRSCVHNHVNAQQHVYSSCSNCDQMQAPYSTTQNNAHTFASMATHIAVPRPLSQRINRFLVTDSYTLYQLGTFRFLFLVEYIRRQHNIHQVIFTKDRWDNKENFCNNWNFYTNNEDHYIRMALHRLLDKEISERSSMTTRIVSSGKSGGGKSGGQREKRVVAREEDIEDTTIVIFSAFPETLLLPELEYINWFLYVGEEYVRKAIREDIVYMNYELIPGILRPQRPISPSFHQSPTPIFPLCISYSPPLLPLTLPLTPPLQTLHLPPPSSLSLSLSPKPPILYACKTAREHIDVEDAFRYDTILTSAPVLKLE